MMSHMLYVYLMAVRGFEFSHQRPFLLDGSFIVCQRGLVIFVCDIFSRVLALLVQSQSAFGRCERYVNGTAAG